MRLTRRRWLQGAAAALPLAFVVRRAARADSFGPLVPDPDGILDLPRDFTYRVIERQGDPMDDGYRVPGAPDGMACFEGAAGTLVLLRNHELTSGSTAGPYGAGQVAPPEAFDAGELGGVTRLVVDAATGARLSSNLVLVGTTRNCAGGTSPWGWLSCEETSLAGHGYVFACSPDAERVQPPDRIPAYGRFVHEAATVDPDTMIAYLTEDDGNGCFYRFRPDDVAAPRVGRLQALRVVGADNLDTGAVHPTGTTWDCAWVDVDDPEGTAMAVRLQAQARGAAIVRRGEGLWLDGAASYFVSTSGGPAALGQIFRFDPDGEGGTLTLVAQGEAPAELESPDNLTVSPWGTVYLVEDGGGQDRILALGADGRPVEIARNVRSDSELTGVCFSPDGRILFVNLQGDGLTLAIVGPFGDVGVRPAGGAGCL